LLAERKTEAALATVRLEPEESDRLSTEAVVLQSMGRHAEADELLQVLIKKYSGYDAYGIAFNYAYRNDPDHALQWLERAYLQKDGSLGEIVGEPLFKNLWADPRYKAFLRKMNLPE
jgi:Flp pilus assembly protein TadD